MTYEYAWVQIALRGEIITAREKYETGLGPRPGETMQVAGGFQVHTVPYLFPEWDLVIDSAVWLTSSPNPEQSWMDGGPSSMSGVQGKGAFRIEVDCPDARWWPEYAEEVGFLPSYRKILNETGARLEHQWWVVQRPIPMRDWVRVTRTADGVVLYDRSSGVGA
jgi:hypothetical protein